MTWTKHTAFFYGTLMHPKVLKGVIRNDGTHLKICPALLLDYTRHEVKDGEYPGILPTSEGIKLFDRPLTQEERSVRGVLVTGLTAEDIAQLDTFEGEEYIREKVEVHALRPLTELSVHSIENNAADDLSPLDFSRLDFPIIGAQTYIYGDRRNLNRELWSFEDFVKNNAWKWFEGSR